MSETPERFKDIEKAIENVLADYEFFIENILGVGEENSLGQEIKIYNIKVKYTEFIEHKEELLKEIEKLRLKIMEELPSAYEIHSKALVDIEAGIVDLKDKGSIEEPLKIKLALSLLTERIQIAIRLGDVERLLSENYDFDKMAVKIFKDGLKKVSKNEKTYIVFDALMKHSSREHPVGLHELSSLLGRNPSWVKSALKTLREEAPELIRIVPVENKVIKYYVPNIYKRYYIV